MPKKTKNFSTTKKHFIYFRERCEHWISVFGLSAWTMAYWHDNLSDNYATCDSKNHSKVAAITLSKDFGTVHTSEDYNIEDHLNRLAFQEVVHMLLEPLDDRVVSTDTMYARHEAIAHSIEHTVLGRPGYNTKKGGKEL